MAWPLRLTPFAGQAVLLVSAASLYGAAVTILLFQTHWVFSVPLVVASVFPLLLYASRNPRLIFLLGMVFTAPLALSINMRGYAHMGGAHALSINLMDFFLAPLIVYLLRDFYLGYRRGFRFSTISLWWLGLIALGTYSVVVGPYRELAAFDVVRMFKEWLLFLVIVNECVREKHFHFVVGALAANAAVNSVVAFMQFAVKGTLGLGPLGEVAVASSLGANVGVYATVGEVFRVSGLAGHANLFGPYVAMLLPVFISQLFTNTRISTKVLLAAVSAGGLVSLGLTLSRSGWLSFVVSGGILMIALFALPDLRKRYLATKALMLGVGSAVLVAGSGIILRRLTESDPGAVNFRLEWIEIAWRMVKEKPVLGFGLNSWIYQFSSYSRHSVLDLYDMFRDVFPVVHNVYLIVWSEQGTIGLLLFLGLHANILWIAIKNLRYRGLSDRIYLLSIALGCGVLAIMVDGMSSFFVKVQAFGRVFWIVVGMLVAAHYWNLGNEALRRQAGGRASPGTRAGSATGLASRST